MQRFTLEKVYFGEAEPEIRRILVDKPTDVIRKTCDYLHIKEHMLVSERRDRIYIDAR